MTRCNYGCVVKKFACQPCFEFSPTAKRLSKLSLFFVVSSKLNSCEWILQMETGRGPYECVCVYVIGECASM